MATHRTRQRLFDVFLIAVFIAKDLNENHVSNYKDVAANLGKRKAIPPAYVTSSRASLQ